MHGNYYDDRIFPALQKLQNENPDIRLFYFNDGLCSELFLNQDLISNINKNIGGGTNIEKALRTLHIKNPEYRKVLVLTDEDYSMIPEN